MMGLFGHRLGHADGVGVAHGARGPV